MLLPICYTLFTLALIINSKNSVKQSVQLKGLSSEILRGSNITSFDRSCFKDVPLGLFFKFYSAAILYLSQIPLAVYNTKKVAFFVFFGFL